MSVPVLEIDGLRVVRGGVQVLELPHLALGAGELLAVCGPNGAGKSTLLLAAAGLLDIAAGAVRLLGQPFHAGRAPAPALARRSLALAQQDPYLFRGRVLADVAYAPARQGCSRSERRARARGALEQLGIGALAGRRVEALSGGERKLVALARALAARPRLLLLDEPTAALDAAMAAGVEAALKGARAADTAVLIATHESGQAQRLGGAELRLRAGRQEHTTSDGGEA